MKLNTVIRLPDGRVGTICYHHIDGYGGVWGIHRFEMPDGGFGNELPMPDFMLRPKEVEGLLRRWGHRPDLECVGEQFEIIDYPEDRERGGSEPRTERRRE